jgi:tetratricopeptide (TPR) repeat protein
VADLEGLGEALGDDGGGEEPRSQPGGTDAVAVAVALDAVRHDPALSRATREYLERQRRLVDLQIQHFDEEHRLAIAAVKRRSLMDRMRIALQLLVAIIGTALVIGIVLLVSGAISDRGVVIDAISVPPDFADRGSSGEAVAKQILDRLAELNRLSITVRAANSYANSLGGNLKLEIPETGVSIGELSRLLHESLGHTTHVGGEISHSGENVLVRIRLGEQYVVESSGPVANLEGLIQEAATRVYARTQPYRYGYWLYQNGDGTGAMTVFRQLAVTGPRNERIWALHGLALTSADNRDSIDFDQQALELDPNFLLARETLSAELFAMGHDELGLKEARAVISGVHGTADSTLSANGEADVLAHAAGASDEAVGDFLGVIASADALAASADNDDKRIVAWRDRIDGLIGLHDTVGATHAMALLPNAAETSGLIRQLNWAGGLAVERNDWQAAAANLEQARTLLDKLPESSRKQLAVRVLPDMALAYAHSGRESESEALLAGFGNDFYQGWCVRGEVATLRNDFANAVKAFAEAVRQGPSIPRGYFYWGQMLAAKGDLAGAIEKYAEANRRGPQWADPLKAWADALFAQGHTREALSKYNAALKRAPNWVQLKSARDKAAASRT